ncbi:MAG: MFS transporter [Clostridia bacterium]|nr:MFS transporter [Clostridia bacterium]
MSNYKVLFGLRTLKNILTNFVDSFLVLYFLDISDSNILPLGIYKLVAIIAIYSVIYLTKNFAKSQHRANLMRIGIILDFIYFLTIILLKDKIVDYIYLVGLLYGLEEGFYYSVYNILESDGITNEERAKFAGTYTAVESILSIVFPLIFGSLIYATSFLKSLIVVFIIILLRIALSFMYKDNNVPKSNKINMKKYFELTNKDKRFKQMYKLEFLNGIVYSEAAFSYIVTIYIIKVFLNSFSLGVFTSIFSIITCIIGILFAKFIKKEDYEVAIKISMMFTIIFLFFMILNCNPITIVLFNLFQTISKKFKNLITGNNQANLSNYKEIAKEYKTEYWLANESALVIGRIISGIIFILLSCINLTIMIIVYALFLILFATNSIKLQKMLMEKELQI